MAIHFRKYKYRAFANNALEAMFIEARKRLSGQAGAVFSWFSVVIWFFYGIVDYAFFAQGLNSWAQIIRLFCLPAFACAGFVFIHPPRWALRFYGPVFVAASVIAITATHAMVFLGQVSAEPSSFYLSLAGLSIMEILLIFGFLRPPYLVSLGLSLYSSAASLFSVWLSNTRLDLSMVRMSEYLVIAILGGSLMHWHADRNDRIRFLQNKRLNQIALLKQKLLIAQDLSRASVAKSRFIAHLSHEIRTPMHGITGMLNLLKRHGVLDKPAHHKLAEGIQVSCDRLLTTLNDMLDYAQLEQGGVMVLRPQDFALPDVPVALGQMYAPLAEKKGLSFNTEWLGEHPPMLHADVEKLYRILNNLVSNAIKFTSKGTVTVAMQAHPVSGSDSSYAVTVSVSDTGIGIPAASLKRIFQAFYQVDAAHTRQFEGNGLGLAITEQIVHALGGQISVTSKANEGTQFVVTLVLDTAAS